jgi:hypothetical protein
MYRSHMYEFHGELRQGRGEQPRPPVGPPSVGSMFCPIIVVALPPAGEPLGDDVLLQVRENMYRLLAAAFDDAGIGWADSRHEGRGDLVVIAVPPSVRAEVLLDDLVLRLRAGLRRHNKLASDIAQVRLRMGVHVGQLTFSPTGMSGTALTRLTDMVEAPAFVRAFTESAVEFGLVASDYMYDEVIRYEPGLIEAAAYDQIKVPTGHAHECAWAHFPSRPARPMRSAPSPSSRAREVA